MQSKHQPLRLEAVRSLAQQTNPKRFDLLTSVAKDDLQSDELRAEAIVGLSAAGAQNRGLLESLATSEHADLRREAAQA